MGSKADSVDVLPPINIFCVFPELPTPDQMFVFVPHVKYVGVISLSSLLSRYSELRKGSAIVTLVVSIIASSPLPLMDKFPLTP